VHVIVDDTRPTFDNAFTGRVAVTPVISDTVTTAPQKRGFLLPATVQPLSPSALP
jgi:hypothetical protein